MATNLASQRKVDPADRLVALEYAGDANVAGLFETPTSGLHLLRSSVEVVEGRGFTGDHAQKSFWRGAYVPGREVSACAIEVLEVLEVEPSVVGDNLLTRGIDLRTVAPGECLAVGEVVLERSAKEHRPCKTFRDRTSDEAFRLAAQGFRGALFLVQKGGRIALGDRIRRLRS